MRTHPFSPPSPHPLPRAPPAGEICADDAQRRGERWRSGDPQSAVARATAHAKAADCHARRGTTASLLAYAAVFVETAWPIHEELARTRWARQHGNQWRRKQRALDDAVQRVKHGSMAAGTAGCTLMVGFGAADLANQHLRRAVPYVQLQLAVVKAVGREHTYAVNEWGGTVHCSYCGARVAEVLAHPTRRAQAKHARRVAAGKQPRPLAEWHTVPGLMACSGGCGRLLPRDVDSGVIFADVLAAHFRGQPRPAHLQPGAGVGRAPPPPRSVYLEPGPHPYVAKRVLQVAAATTAALLGAAAL